MYVFSGVRGLEINDDIGIISSMIGVGDSGGTDFDCSCSGLFAFSDEGAELIFERRGGGIGGDGDLCWGEGDGDFC